MAPPLVHIFSINDISDVKSFKYKVSTVSLEPIDSRRIVSSSIRTSGLKKNVGYYSLAENYGGRSRLMALLTTPASIVLPAGVR